MKREMFSMILECKMSSTLRDQDKSIKWVKPVRNITSHKNGKKITPIRFCWIKTVKLIYSYLDDFDSLLSLFYIILTQPLA